MPRNATIIESALKSGIVSIEGGKVLISPKANAGVRAAIEEASRHRMKLPSGSRSEVPVADLIKDASPIEGQVLVFLAAIAKAAIEKKYQSLGGPSSRLGYPIDGAVKVRRLADAWVSDFRGGRVETRILPDGTVGQTQAEYRYRCEVWFVGLECNKQQEGEDEVYGTVSVMTPAAATTNAVRFPPGDETWDMNTGNFVPQAIKVYDGVPNDLIIGSILVESDSGDTGAIKEKIAKKLIEAGTAAMGAGGLEAETAAANDGFVNDVTLGLVNLVADALGVDDDPYLPQVFRLDWREIQSGAFPRKMHGHTKYTHVVQVTGRDDGGDEGIYQFYYEVRLFEERQLA